MLIKFKHSLLYEYFNYNQSEKLSFFHIFVKKIRLLFLGAFGKTQPLITDSKESARGKAYLESVQDFLESGSKFSVVINYFKFFNPLALIKFFSCFVWLIVYSMIELICLLFDQLFRGSMEFIERAAIYIPQFLLVFPMVLLKVLLRGLEPFNLLQATYDYLFKEDSVNSSKQQGLAALKDKWKVRYKALKQEHEYSINELNDIREQYKRYKSQNKVLKKKIIKLESQAKAPKISHNNNFEIEPFRIEQGTLAYHSNENKSEEKIADVKNLKIDLSSEKVEAKDNQPAEQQSAGIDLSFFSGVPNTPHIGNTPLPNEDAKKKTPPFKEASSKSSPFLSSNNGPMPKLALQAVDSAGPDMRMFVDLNQAITNNQKKTDHTLRTHQKENDRKFHHLEKKVFDRIDRLFLEKRSPVMYGLKIFLNNRWFKAFLLLLVTIGIALWPILIILGPQYVMSLAFFSFIKPAALVFSAFFSSVGIPFFIAFLQTVLVLLTVFMSLSLALYLVSGHLFHFLNEKGYLLNFFARSEKLSEVSSEIGLQKYLFPNLDFKDRALLSTELSSSGDENFPDRHLSRKNLQELDLNESDNMIQADLPFSHKVHSLDSEEEDPVTLFNQLVKSLGIQS